MKKTKFLFARCLTLLILALLSTNLAWGDKITTLAGITSGESYYIGATVSGTDYYFKTDVSKAATGVSGTSTTDKTEAVVATITKTTGGYSIQVGDGLYLSLESGKANGKVNIVASAADWTFTESSNLINMKINGYCLMRNNNASTMNFGSYESGQKNVWLESAGSVAKHNVTWSINGNTSRTEEVAENKAITFPTDIEDIGTKKFVGWSAAPIAGTTNTPTLVTSATMGKSDITYYAVFADAEGDGNAEYSNVTTFTVGKTYIFGAVKAAASSTLANNTTFGAVAFTNTYNSSSPNWGQKVDLTPDANGKIAANNTSITDECKWLLESIDDGNYKFKKGTNYLYLGTSAGSSSGAQSGVSTTGNCYIENVNPTCKDAFLLHPSSSSTNIMLYNTSSGYRMYASRSYSATMAPYVRFYEYDPGVTYSNYCTTVVVKTLDHISVSGEQKSFFVGDEFKHDQMTVMAHYDDETSENVTASAAFSTPDMTSAGEKDVTVTYGDKEASYKINVQAVVLTSVVVSGEPTKTEYFVGESFNPAGLVVTGHYNNGTQATITEGITWAVTPETFTETTQTSVSVTATVSDVTSGAYEVTGLTITSPASAYTLTAEPAEGGSYTVTVGGDPAVEVTAEAKQFMVTEGTVIVVEATANEHYKVHSTPFEGKYADETPIIFDNTGVAKKKQFTYGTADATITAKFLQMYAVNIDKNIEHGTVVADPVEATPNTGITLTLTPDAHYHFESVTVKDKNGGDIALEGEPTTTEEGITTAKFKMPAAEDTKGDVSVTATFAEDAKYTVTFSINGIKETKENYAGEVIEFPENPSVEGYTFMGWTTEAINGTQQTTPTFVNKETAVYPTNNNTLYYAVFAKKEGEDKYVKVTSAPTDWSGEYLLVYESSETKGVAWTGVDAGQCRTDVTISNGEIATKPDNAVTLTIAAMDGGYSILVNGGTNDGNYINQNTYDNKISFNETPSANTLSYSSSENSTVIAGSGEKDGSHVTMRYNNTSGDTNERFRYYKSGQQPVQLYKKQEATYSNYCTDISYSRDVTSGNFGTLCLPYAATIEGAEVYSVEGVDSKDTPATLYLKKVEGTTEAGVPYIIKPTEDKLVATYSGNAVATAGNANGLVGSFVKAEITAGAKNYILKNNLWCYVPEGNTNYVGAYKAYLNLNDVEVISSGAKGDFEMVFDGNVTSINLVPTTEEIGGAMYNLNGMQVNANYKGIVVKNGKKFINK